MRSRSRSAVYPPPLSLLHLSMSSHQAVQDCCCNAPPPGHQTKRKTLNFFHPTHHLFCPSFDLRDANVEDETQVRIRKQRSNRSLFPAFPTLPRLDPLRRLGGDPLLSPPPRRRRASVTVSSTQADSWYGLRDTCRSCLFFFLSFAKIRNIGISLRSGTLFSFPRPPAVGEKSLVASQRNHPKSRLHTIQS